MPCDLDAIIVTIPAYEDSNSRWQADRTLATIQSAVARPATRWSASPAPGRAGERRRRATPIRMHGAVRASCCSVALGCAAAGLRWQPREGRRRRNEVLAVLTVPEMPMSGIERVPLLLAAHLALTLHSVPHPDGPSHAAQVRLVGPFYSGSSLSLLRGLEEMAYLEGERSTPRPPGARHLGVGDKLEQLPHPVGSARARWPGHLRTDRAPGRDLLLALQDQLGSIRPEWASGQGVALLVESNTGWGASLGQSAGPGDAARGPDRSGRDRRDQRRLRSGNRRRRPDRSFETRCGSASRCTSPIGMRRGSAALPRPRSSAS